MLSIDEDRSVLSPTAMEMNEGAEPVQMTQLYFCGAARRNWWRRCKTGKKFNCMLRFCIEDMQRRAIQLNMNMDLIPPYGDMKKIGEEIQSSCINRSHYLSHH